ncbi:MAG: hypothetical protein LC792_05220 [Actinobacteria bacterium]|nr:hypothetical protein [Actinomycetota bacterium]
MRLSKKLVSGIVAGVATVTIAGTAFAYLTATGTADGAVKTGSSSPWKIDGVATLGGDLLPGNGFQQAVNYTITNVSGGVQKLNAVSATVKTDADGSVLGIPGCPADSFYVMTSWQGQDFAPLGEFNGGAAKAGHVVLGMNNLHVNQDACQNHNIPVLISAS